MVHAGTCIVKLICTWLVFWWITTNSTVHWNIGVKIDRVSHHLPARRSIVHDGSLSALFCLYSNGGALTISSKIIQTPFYTHWVASFLDTTVFFSNWITHAREQNIRNSIQYNAVLYNRTTNYEHIYHWIELIYSKGFILDSVGLSQCI